MTVFSLTFLFPIFVCILVLPYILYRVKKANNATKNSDIMGNCCYALPMGPEQACLALLRFDAEDVNEFYFDDKTNIITFEGTHHYQLSFLEFEGRTYLYAESILPLLRKRPNRRIRLNKFFEKVN